MLIHGHTRVHWHRHMPGPLCSPAQPRRAAAPSQAPPFARRISTLQTCTRVCACVCTRVCVRAPLWAWPRRLGPGAGAGPQPLPPSGECPGGPEGHGREGPLCTSQQKGKLSHGAGHATPPPPPKVTHRARNGLRHLVYASPPDTAAPPELGTDPGIQAPHHPRCPPGARVETQASWHLPPPPPRPQIPPQPSQPPPQLSPSCVGVLPAPPNPFLGSHRPRLAPPRPPIDPAPPSLGAWSCIDLCPWLRGALGAPGKRRSPARPSHKGRAGLGEPDRAWAGGGRAGAGLAPPGLPPRPRGWQGGHGGHPPSCCSCS